MSTVATVASSAIQDGAYDALAADSTFFATQLGGRFYTDVPQGTAFPLAWLAFEEPIETDQSTFGTVIKTIHLAIHVYSDYEGDDQALDIMQRAVETLDAGFTATGWTVIWVDGNALARGGGPSLLVENYEGRALRHGVVRVDVHARRN